MQDELPLRVRSQSQVLEDYRETVIDQVAEGDKVATRIIGLGKAAGELLGVSGNGRPITVTANVLTHFDNAGLIVEEWVEADAYGLLKQLGAL